VASISVTCVGVPDASLLTLLGAAGGLAHARTASRLLPPAHRKAGGGWRRGSWPQSRRRAGSGPTPYDAAVC
jgi:hypothetical protein